MNITVNYIYHMIQRLRQQLCCGLAINCGFLNTKASKTTELMRYVLNLDLILSINLLTFFKYLSVDGKMHLYANI